MLIQNTLISQFFYFVGGWGWWWGLQGREWTTAHSHWDPGKWSWQCRLPDQQPRSDISALQQVHGPKPCTQRLMTSPCALCTRSADLSVGRKWFLFSTQKKRHTISTYSKECRADKVPIKNILHEVIIWYQNVTVSIMCQGNKGRENSGATSNELSWSMP